MEGKRRYIISILFCTVATLCVGCGYRPAVMYTGPRRPHDQVALLDFGSFVNALVVGPDRQLLRFARIELLTLDGQPAPSWKALMGGPVPYTLWEVLPGEHSIGLECYVYDDGPKRAGGVLRIDARPGHKYIIGLLFSEDGQKWSTAPISRRFWIPTVFDVTQTGRLSGRLSFVVEPLPDGRVRCGEGIVEYRERPVSDPRR